MKTMKIWRIAFAMLAAFSLASCCSDDEDMINDAYKTLSGIALTDWPLTDCSTSTRPVRDLVTYKLLDVPYMWEVDWMSGTTYIIMASRDISRNACHSKNFATKKFVMGLAFRTAEGYYYKKT